MSVKELIEQIGGRDRLEFIAEDCAEARFSEIETMARALLAVLDAKPVGTVSIVPDLYSIPRRNIATVNMRPDLVMSEMRDGDNLYAVPVEANVSEIITVAKAMREWIDAIPKDVVASLPAMPGFDRDWADEVISSVAPSPENKK